MANRFLPGFASLLAAALVLAFSFPASAGFDRGPWLQNITETSVELLYDAGDTDADGLVEYGTTTSYGDSVPATKRWVLEEYFSADITGLASNTRYYYRLTHEGTEREGWFWTAPEPGESGFTFAVVGDTRSGHTAHQAIVDAIVDELSPEYPDLYFNTGDLVADGGDKSDWRIFFPIEEDILRHTIYSPSYGNHEVPDLGHTNYFQKFFNSGDPISHWYAFPYGNAYFIVLNTQKSLSPALSQGQFISAQLALAESDPDIDFIFVFFHQPGMTTSTSHTPSADVLTSLFEPMQNHNVDAVFTGHNHLYERGLINGIYHVVTGGGGAGLYNYIDPYTSDGWVLGPRESVNHYCMVTVDDASYTVYVKRLDGSVIDTFTGYAADGGQPGPVPPDLLERALGCGGCMARSMGGRVPDVDASTGLIRVHKPSSWVVHVAGNGFLYVVPGLFVIVLRRKLRRRS